MDYSGIAFVAKEVKGPPRAMCAGAFIARGGQGPVTAGGSTGPFGPPLPRTWDGVRQVGGSSFTTGASVVETTGASVFAAALPNHQGEGPVRVVSACIGTPESLAAMCLVFCSALALGEHGTGRLTHQRGGPCTPLGRA